MPTVYRHADTALIAKYDVFFPHWIVTILGVRLALKPCCKIIGCTTCYQRKRGWSAYGVCSGQCVIFLTASTEVYCHVIQFNIIPLNFIFLWSYVYLVWFVFPLLLWGSTGHLSHGFFHQFSWHSWPLPHPLISEPTRSAFSNQQTLLPTENCPQCQKWSPYKAEKQFLCLFVPKRGGMTKLVQTKDFS